MEVEGLIPFKVELVRPPDSMRELCPPPVWPKICDFDYAGHAGPWTVVGIANSDVYGAHLLLVQPGRMPEYVPRLACMVLSVESRIHLCPVCNGAGTLQCPLPAGLTGAGTWRKDCHGCSGKGWVSL